MGGWWWVLEVLDWKPKDMPKNIHVHSKRQSLAQKKQIKTKDGNSPVVLCAGWLQPNQTTTLRNILLRCSCIVYHNIETILIVIVAKVNNCRLFIYHIFLYNHRSYSTTTVSTMLEGDVMPSPSPIWSPSPAELRAVKLLGLIDSNGPAVPWCCLGIAKGYCLRGWTWRQAL